MAICLTLNILVVDSPPFVKQDEISVGMGFEATPFQLVLPGEFQKGKPCESIRFQLALPG